MVLSLLADILVGYRNKLNIKNLKKRKKVSIKLRNILGQKSLIVNGILAYKEEHWGKKKY